MNLNVLAAQLMLLIISLSSHAQTYNTTINCHFTNISGKGKVFVYVNDIKTDSLMADNGNFTWKGNLTDISQIWFGGYNYINYAPKFLVCQGIYNIEFDTISRFLKNAVTGEKHHYISHTIKKNDNLEIENDYKKLIQSLGQLDSNNSLKTDSVYANKKQFILDFLEKYHDSKMLPIIAVLGNNKLFKTEELKHYFYQSDSSYQNSELGLARLDIISKNHLSEIGTALPEIAAITPDSASFSISSLKGKYVFIDFWASWCIPCRGENPLLRKLHNSYHSKGLEMVSFSLDDDIEKWKTAIEKDSMNWIHISDLNGWKRKDGIDDRFGIYGIPDNYLIDPNGVVIDKGLHGMLLEKRLKELFEQN